jgi:hypothetical protein
MTKYNLVNPYIDGNINTSVKANNELKGAGKMYEKVLAPIFITSAPEFNFSIEGEGKIYHYTVKESVKGDNAKFKIEKFDGKVDNDKFKTKLHEIKIQSGGKSKHKHKSKDDDSSSSSSSSDSPSHYSISRYCYSPYIYTPYTTTGTSYTYTVPILSPTYMLPTTHYYYWNYGFTI